MKKNVIIVGAGAAGLIAARELCDHYQVTLLESRQQTGGRIRTDVLPGGQVVEGGAEFIHGRLPITLQLCKEAKIEYVPAEGKMYRREKNNWVEETEMIEGWDELINKMGALKQDMTLQDFLVKNYAGDAHADLRRHIVSYVQGFDLADPEKVSVQALYQEWSHEDEDNFRIPAGYQALTGFLENECVKNGCIIIRGDAVRQVDWQQDEVTAYTASGKKYAGEKILITVPLGVLTGIAGSTAINFTPAIDERIRAAADIGYGTVVKVACDFKKRLWQADTRFIFSDETIPTWWTQLPADTNLLTGWVGGPGASVLGKGDDASIMEAAFASLAHIFNVGLDEIRNNIRQSYIFNWLAHEEALGAYSYPMLRTAPARKILNTPLGNTLFFAGEGLYEGDFPGTVEAALANGLQCARNMRA